MGRDELVAELQDFLRRAGRGGSILDPTGLALASRLGDLARPDDMPAQRLVALLHWLRHLALPVGADQGDLRSALAAFKRLIDVDDQAIPGPVRAVLRSEADLDVAGAAIRNIEATELLRDPDAANNITAVSRAVALLRCAVAETAADHPNRARRLANLGAALHTRHGLTRHADDLDAAIEAMRSAGAATPAGHHSLPSILVNFRRALLTRYERVGSLADLHEAIDVDRTAIEADRKTLATTRLDNPERAERWATLGVDLHTRYERTGQMSDVDNAVMAHRESIAATHADQPDRPRYLSNLGSALRARVARTANRADVTEAIDVGRASVDATPMDDPERGGRLSNLSVAYLTRHDHTGDAADLDAAVTAGCAAAEATPPGHPDRASIASNLGIVLQTRYRHAGRLTDLNQAVEAGRASVEETPDGHPDLAARLSNLSAALRTRHERIGDLADVTEAVQASQAAVQATPADHVDRATMLANLGVALRTRHEATGSLVDLDAAVEAGRASVEVTDAEHPERAMCLANLAGSLQVRHERMGAQADVDAAIEACRGAIAAVPGDHPERAMYLAHLGGSLRSRYERSNDIIDLDAAVEAGRAAVTATPSDHSERAGRLSNLGAVLRTRYGRTSDPTDLDAAIEASRAAVTACASDHPGRAMFLTTLGLALRARYGLTRTRADLAAAVQASQEAVDASPADHPDRAMFLANLGFALSARYRETGRRRNGRAALTAFRAAAAMSTGQPLARAESAQLYAELAADLGRWARARRATVPIFELLAQLVDHGLSPSDRRHHLQRLQGLGPQTAEAQLGPRWREWWRRGHRTDAAWTALEAGRGVLLGQALEVRSNLAELAEHDPERAAQVQRLRVELNRDPGSMATDSAATVDSRHAERATHRLVEQRRALADQWREVLARVRSQPGFDRFGRPPTIAQLRSAADTGTIVAINVAAHRCDALLLTARTSACLPLPGLTRDHAVMQANRFLDALYQDPDQPDTTVIHAVLAWLWDSVVGPVLRRLGHIRPVAHDQTWPRVWWMPTGAMSLLPLHAAGHHLNPPDAGRPTALDLVVSSYTPTARALHRARHRLNPKPDGTALIVGVNHTHVPGAAPLRQAEAEAMAVRAALSTGNDPLLGPAASRPAVLHALPQASWAHFACHGYADQDDPAESHLALYDAALTVRDLGQLDLPKAHLAFLSACTTATGSPRLLDETIHIAAAFQTAGFPHAVATLWPIGDYLAPDIAAQVYQAIIAGADPAHALHHTVRDLRRRYPRHPQLWASYLHFGP